ncbi:MAG TPA: sulfite exporter TauE/SafE family protein [Polyangiaceae bacterium]
MEASLIPSLLLSGLIGLSLGIFGGGGSILAVPVLVLVTRLAPAAAVGTSLAMVGTTSLIASYAHYRRGQVKPNVALLFGLSGVVSAFLGAKLTALVSGSVIMHSFAALMLVVGVGMLFGKGRRAGVEGNGSPTRSRLTASVIAGAAVGLITGFLGVGGGFLVVPALIVIAGLDMRKAVGTSLLVIAINSAAGFLGHLGTGHLDLVLTAPLTAAAVAGALVGERVARHVSTSKLRRGFGLIVIAVGVTVALAARLGSGARPRNERPAFAGTQRATIAPAQTASCSTTPSAWRRDACRERSSGVCGFALHSLAVEEASWLA